MKLFPYAKFQIESEYNAPEIKALLTNLISKPDWNITLAKFVNNVDTLEGKAYDTSFVICKGKFGLSYGRTSLLPIMKGKINKNPKSEMSIISVIIRPFKAGIAILSLFYLLCFFGLYASIAKNLIEVFIVCIIFIGLTYYSLISKFNREYIFYKDFISNHISKKI